MDEQTRQAVANAIDNALTTVAMREYNRLANGMSPEQIKGKIEYALDSLGELSNTRGNMPSYDEWVALFYHWYQPSQVNLAYSMIKSTTIVNDKLYIVDWGCGSLAMQFGVALATADALEQMQPVSEIRIDSLDTSDAMVNMGQKIWEQFKVEVNRNANLRYVSLACEIISPQEIILTRNPLMAEFNKNTTWATAWQSDCWISAIHLVYEDNKDNARHNLSSLVSMLNPNICFATTHSSKYGLLEEVWDFIDYNKYRLPELTIQQQFSGVLPEITQWRKNLNSALQINYRKNNRDYLDSNVTWEWPNAAFRIHAKVPTPTDADDLPW